MSAHHDEDWPWTQRPIHAMGVDGVAFARRQEGYRLHPAWDWRDEQAARMALGPMYVDMESIDPEDRPRLLAAWTAETVSSAWEMI